MEDVRSKCSSVTSPFSITRTVPLEYPATILPEIERVLIVILIFKFMSSNNCPSLNPFYNHKNNAHRVHHESR